MMLMAVRSITKLLARPDRILMKVKANSAFSLVKDQTKIGLLLLY